MSLRVFPVLGGAHYTDDFAYQKPDGRSHQGNDLMAPEGTPLVAVDDGTVKYGTDVFGGNVANLYSPDGTHYYYAHLSRFENGAPGTSRAVRAGDVIGYVGTTGNAVGGPSHVHFEVHPENGAAVDPFPYLSTADVRSERSTAASSSRTLATLAFFGLGLAAVLWLTTHPKMLRRTRSA